MNNLLQEPHILEKYNTWVAGYGVIRHNETTIGKVTRYIQELNNISTVSETLKILDLLIAADRVCSASMWLIAHMTYASKVSFDERLLNNEDFKKNAQGHTGGSLNMAPAYTGYFLANALSGCTRAWLMEQGHCVAAIEAINAILGNQDLEQALRYGLTEEGLSRLCSDFYNYELEPNGKPKAYLGSHVNAYTSGGIGEGGYLGFAGLQYVHMPLPGQELVAFLSDGAFEEQRGSDWAPRWWRAEDTGLVMPIMIANGRRIDQRTMMQQKGGVESFKNHLQLNGFDPFIIDGTDPAAFAMSILTMSKTLRLRAEEIAVGQSTYPVKIPYAIAETTKGYGLPNAGTNAAHSLPLGGSLRDNNDATAAFQEATEKLYVNLETLKNSVETLKNHHVTKRVREKDHFMRCIKTTSLMFPKSTFSTSADTFSSLSAIDSWFCDFTTMNPLIRFKVGNPDEIKSNRMEKTLAALKHRVTQPEDGVSESITGSVVTVLNEEAVVSAALANKLGVSLVISYEAFATKMIGAMRQEMIFSRHQKEAGRSPNWVSVPVIATSHTWENGKNEQSHQDPTFSEVWLNEMSDVAPVYFPIDAPSAVATLKRVYETTGRIAALVVAKKELPVLLDMAEAEKAVIDGMVVLLHAAHPEVQFLAVGGYQVKACIGAAKQLISENIPCSVIAILEPGRFREPRDEIEADYCHTEEAIRDLIPPAKYRVVVTHTRADILTGVFRQLDLGRHCMRFLGYRNHGGTLNTEGMQKINDQSSEQIAQTAKEMMSQRTRTDADYAINTSCSYQR